MARRLMSVLLAAVLAASGSTLLAPGLAASAAPPRALQGHVIARLPDGMVGVRLSPRPERVGVGLPLTFHVWAVSADGKDLTEVTDSATVMLGQDGCAGGICTPTKAGSYGVTATVYNGDYPIYADSVDFEALDVDGLDLEPARAIRQPGGTVSYQARAYARWVDVRAGSGKIDLGDVTTVTALQVGGAPCDGSECRAPTKEGMYKVSGAVHPLQGPPVPGAAGLEVEHGSPRSMTLKPGEATVAVGKALTYRATADDGFGNLFNVSTTALFAAGPDVSCTGPVCTPRKPGRYTVTATVGEKPRVSATATLVAEQRQPVELRLRPRTVSIVVGTSQPYRARGIGAGGTDLGEVTARTVFTIDKSGSCDRRGCGASVPGTYTVTGELADDPEVTGTATLTVLRRPAVSVRLDPERSRIVAGATQTYRATALDDRGRDVGDVTGKVTLSIEDTSPLGRIGSCDGPRCGARSAGTYLVTGRVPGILRRGTARLTVMSAPLARLALAPSAASIVAGATQAYTVGGFEANGESLGELTGRATFSIRPGGSCTGSRCTSDKAGTYTVAASVVDKATGATVTGTAELRVDPAELAAVRLSPASARVLAGADQSYTSLGFDAYGNTRGDVTARTTFTIDADGECAGASCSAARTGLYTVTGTVTGAEVVGGAISGTSSLRVGPARPARLVLEPQQATVGTGGGQAYTAHGYDALGNDVGDVTAQTTFSISPPGSCHAATCSGREPATYTVTGQLAGLDVRGDARLTVVPGTPTRLELDPPQRTVAPGAEQAYRALGYDAFGVSLGDVTSRTVFSIDGGRCAGAVCSAEQAGDHLVTGRVVGTDAIGTARLMVQATGPPTVAGLVLTPAVSSVSVGAVQTYSARGLDAGGNDRGDVTGRTAFSIEPDGFCDRSACRAERGGPHRVVGVLTGTGVRQAARLDVTETTPARLLLDPPTASVGVRGIQSYRARAFDAVGNDLGDVSDRVILLMTNGGSCVGQACSATKPGTYGVTAVPLGGGRVGRATLTVTAAAPVALILSPTSASVVQRTTQPYQSRGLDAAGNDLGDMTARTAFTIAPGGSCVAAVCTVKDPGEYTVTGRVSGTAVSASATLRAVALATVDEPSGTGGPDWVLLLGGGFLLAAAARSALRRIRQGPGRPHDEPAGSTADERDEDWVRRNIRTQPYPGPVSSAARRRERRPDLVVHLEAHADPSGAQTVEENSSWR
jgi:hypothetical protein